MKKQIRFLEKQPRANLIKKRYIALMLWFVGRAVQAAARHDADVKKEFDKLPDGFTFSLGVLPEGPAMVVGKDGEGVVRYLGWKLERQPIHLAMKIKNLEAAMLMFTFQESTAEATCNDRLIIDGEVPPACAVVRVLDTVEVYLLPWFLAGLAVKRYPRWNLIRKLTGRCKIYWSALFSR
jgi:hypothetical protein